MKRTITVFGILAGLIVSALLVLALPLMHCADGKAPAPYSMLVGYASMLLAFSLIFVAVKSQRDKHQGGVITFGRAFLTGLGIAVIGTVFYTVTWVIIYKNFYPTFLDDMIRAQLAGMVREGATQSAIEAKRLELDGMRSMYSTWPGLIGFTMLEIFPVGLLVSLIAALVMKRKPQGARLATA